MLAAGQMLFDTKNKYIRQNKSQKTPPLPEKLQADDQMEQNLSPQAHSPPTNDQPEETFKTVHNKLLLNQSAMSPNKEDTANQKLDDLALKSDQVLLKVSTVFPFTFFVHDIIIDPYKVNIIFRQFFWSEQIHSILIRDILDIVVETSLFFATVKIVDQGYVENTVDIAYLKREDAMQVRKIVQGLVIAHRQSVDLSVMHSSDIKSKTEELGKVKGIDKETG